MYMKENIGNFQEVRVDKQLFHSQNANERMIYKQKNEKNREGICESHDFCCEYYL